MNNDIASFLISTDDGDAVITRARGHGRELATRLGFPEPRLFLVTIIISELARNIVMYAKVGQISLEIRKRGRTSGLVIVASDQGPGIANLERALLCGYSTSGSNGCGLPAVSRIADDFSIDTRPGVGTTVNVALWPDRPQRAFRPLT
ncbi:MAG: anti-sigma regulatory factor [Pseudomonadota bacterium]